MFFQFFCGDQWWQLVAERWHACWWMGVCCQHPDCVPVGGGISRSVDGCFALLLLLCVSPCLCSSGLQLRCFWAHGRLTSIKKSHYRSTWRFFSQFTWLFHSRWQNKHPPTSCVPPHPPSSILASLDCSLLLLVTSSSWQLNWSMWNSFCHLGLQWALCCCLCCQPLINITSSYVCGAIKSVSQECNRAISTMRQPACFSRCSMKCQEVEKFKMTSLVFFFLITLEPKDVELIVVWNK